MPDKRHHRGQHPQDADLFAPPTWPALQQATADLSWLLGRGYAQTSALKLAGDRYGLRQRQRLAVMRSAAGSEALVRRHRHEVSPNEIEGEPLHLDGYNVLMTVETALAGGIVLATRDGCYRDMASVHGSYRKVEETVPALRLIGAMLASWRVGRCRWLLDRPVSNSGRLKGIIEETAQTHDWDWQVELPMNPDKILATSAEIVATSDSVILDKCPRWVNLARRVIEAQPTPACIVPMDITS